MPGTKDHDHPDALSNVTGHWLMRKRGLVCTVNFGLDRFNSIHTLMALAKYNERIETLCVSRSGLGG